MKRIEICIIVIRSMKVKTNLKIYVDNIQEKNVKSIFVDSVFFKKKKKKNWKSRMITNVQKSNENWATRERCSISNEINEN